MKKRFTYFLIAVFLLIPGLSLAKMGVGVGTGKIVMDQELKAGTYHNLPALTVINTGDEPADYGVSVSHRENQPELKPNAEWFTFSPNSFHLDPGQAQRVEIKVNLPIKIQPGDYFAFLEAHLNNSNQDASKTSIGIAAASKLYFTVAPSNFIQGIYYRIISFIFYYRPWTYIVPIVIFLAILITIFRKKFVFNISIGKKQ